MNFLVLLISLAFFSLARADFKIHSMSCEITNPFGFPLGVIEKEPEGFTTTMTYGVMGNQTMLIRKVTEDSFYLIDRSQRYDYIVEFDGHLEAAQPLSGQLSMKYKLGFGGPKVYLGDVKCLIELE